MYFFCNFLKHFRNTSSTLCRHFRPYHLMLLSEGYRMRCLHFLVFRRQVALVSRKGHDEPSLVSGGVLFHFVHPILDWLKCMFVRQIVADYRTNSVPIVHIDHGAEPLVAARIPDVHLHLLLSCIKIITVRNADNFLKVSPTNCYIVYFIKPILTESHCDWWLSYSTIS